MKNQPGNMKNQPGIMKNHENRPGTVNNQPGTMNTHENRPGTINKQKRYKQTDRQNLPIIYRYVKTALLKVVFKLLTVWSADGMIALTKASDPRKQTGLHIMLK